MGAMLRILFFVCYLYWVMTSASAYEIEKHDNGDPAWSRRAQHVFGNHRATWPWQHPWSADVNRNGDAFGIVDGVSGKLIQTDGKVQCYRDLPFGKWHCRAKDVFPDVSHFSVETEQRGDIWVHWLKIFTKEQMSHCPEVKEEEPTKHANGCRGGSFTLWYFVTVISLVGVVVVTHMICCDVYGNKCQFCGKVVENFWSILDHQHGRCKHNASESVAAASAAVAEHERASEVLRRAKADAENALEAQREVLRRAKADAAHGPVNIVATAEVAQKMSASDTN